MNMETSNVVAPPAPRSLDGMRLPIVMMRDILLKTIFRKSVSTVSEIARAICLPASVTQELIDMGDKLICWNCGAALDGVPVPVSRHEHCPRCSEALRSPR